MTSIECEEKTSLFPCVLWSHSISDQSWDISSYNIIYDINTVGKFWYIFNNLPSCDIKNNHFYLMRKDVDPIWEHADNRNGGVCSFRVLLKDSIKLLEYLGVLMLCNKLYDGDGNNDDITGISVSPKNNWSIVKIWNKDKSVDVVSRLNGEIKRKYPSISIQYKVNNPEY